MTVADWQANFHRLECCRHLELLPEWTVHAVVGREDEKKLFSQLF